MNQSTVELEDILETGVWEAKERIPFTRPKREDAPPATQPIPYKPVPAQPVTQPIAASDLEAGIAEAEAAQEELDRMEVLRQQASQLQALKKRQKELQWAEAVAPAADDAEQQAKLLLDRSKPKITQWQKDFLEAFSKIEQLIQELPELQKDLNLAIDHVQRATTTRQRIDAIQGKESSDFLQDTGFELWQQIGGTDPALAPLPIHSDRWRKWEPVIQLLKGRLPFIYAPNGSYKYFR